MAERNYPNLTRPSKFEDRYRLYLDESGDHAFREDRRACPPISVPPGLLVRNPDYHLGLGFLLQRFAGYLNHINRVGDILGESRGP